MHNSYKQFLFHSFLSALHVSKVSSSSSSGAQHDILYYTVQSVQSCLRYDCTDCTKLCNTVYYAVLLMMNDQIRSKHVEQRKNCGMKIDYKNCTSRWLLTHCNMMHGAHNVKCTCRFVTKKTQFITMSCCFREEHFFCVTNFN